MSFEAWLSPPGHSRVLCNILCLWRMDRALSCSPTPTPVPALIKTSVQGPCPLAGCTGSRVPSGNRSGPPAGGWQVPFRSIFSVSGALYIQVSRCPGCEWWPVPSPPIFQRPVLRSPEPVDSFLSGLIVTCLNSLVLHLHSCVSS